MLGRWLMFGAFGEEQNFYADTLGNQRYEIGQKMLLPDGRTFRAADVGAVTLVAGNVLGAQVGITNHIGQTMDTASAKGATAYSFKLAGTSVDYDQYRNGMVLDESGGTGKSFAYPIASHANQAASAEFSVPLQSGSSVTVASNTSDVSTLLANPYKNVIQYPAATTTTQPCGVAISNAVAVGSIDASGGNAKGVKLGNLCWVQTGGLAAVLGHGTLVIGNGAATGTTAGAIDPQAGDILPVIGWVARVVAAASWSGVYLTIDI